LINFVLTMDTATGAIRDVPRVEDALALRDEPRHVVWIDVLDPTEADLAALREEFGFHSLSLEDCLHQHQRPKCETYDDHVFMVLYEFAAPVARAGTVEPLELMLFLGARYVVTVHAGPVAATSLAAERWRAVTGLEADAEAYLAYLVIDAAVDTYFPVVDALADRLEDLEDDILEGRDEAVIKTVTVLKKQTLGVRRLVTPLRDIFLVLMRGPGSQFGARTYAYYQDVLDHLLRVTDAIDIHRDVLASAVDLYMSTVSNRTNETMKKLTVLSTVLMSSALIAGIYGMNFAYMPELHHPYGYYGALGAMAGISAVLLALFRWRRYI
jgi:magnesium transporter